MHGDPRTNLHNPAGPDPDGDASADRLQEWLEHWQQYGFGYWVVEALDVPTAEGQAVVIGFTGVRTAMWLERPILNLYYRYAVEHWGRGYATEGVKRTLDWARTHHPQLPVLASTTLDNIGSQRTASAAGLVRRPDLEMELSGVHRVVFVSGWPATS